MAEPRGSGIDGAHCFRTTPPLGATKAWANRNACDLAIPNDAGIGNILVYTRLVDDLAKRLGRPLSILTAPLNPASQLLDGDDGFAIWRHNPHVRRIVDAGQIDARVMEDVNAERDNIVQYGHMLENIAYHYGLRPSLLRPSIYLNESECAWAFETLADFARPIILLHPYSTSGPPAGFPWYRDAWLRLINKIGGLGSIIEVRQHGREDKYLGLTSFPTTLRQMFALVWAADVVVCLDSVVSHVATAFERFPIVLWDPSLKVIIEEKWQAGFALAALSRWSYPQNENVMLLASCERDLVDIIAELVARKARLGAF